MNRRTLLRGLAALSAGAAGCTDNNREVPATAPDGPVGVRESTPEPQGGGGSVGPDEEEPEQPLVVPEFDAVPADDGTLVVTVTVENTLAEPHSAEVVVSVDAAGEEYVERRGVTLQGGASDTYRFPFDVQYDDLEGFDVTFEEGTPASPGEDDGTPASGDA